MQEKRMRDDLISRQAAIEAMSESLKRVFPEHRQIAEKCLKALPSAQPEKRTEERTETHACDCISRQAAIDAVCESCSIEGDYHKCNGYPKDSTWCEEITALRNLPSAQPEIIRCKDCKHHWTHRCMDSMPTEICELDQTFYDANVDFCSLAERRTDDQSK